MSRFFKNIVVSLLYNNMARCKVQIIVHDALIMVLNKNVVRVTKTKNQRSYENYYAFELL